MSLTASEYKNISNLLKLSSPVIIHILIKSHSAVKQFSPLHHCSSNLMQFKLPLLLLLCFCLCVLVYICFYYISSILFLSRWPCICPFVDLHFLDKIKIKL